MAIKKVLVVDDSSTDRQNLEQILQATGCEVISAKNGKVAIELAKSEQPDIIFMDIVMDEMDGYEATREISNNSETQSIPVIFVSSKKQKADRVWAKMQGGKELVSKPFTPEQILDQIKTFSN